MEIKRFSLAELLQFWLGSHHNPLPGWQWLQFCEPVGTAAQQAADERLTWHIQR